MAKRIVFEPTEENMAKIEFLTGNLDMTTSELMNTLLNCFDFNMAERESLEEEMKEKKILYAKSQIIQFQNMFKTIA